MNVSSKRWAVALAALGFACEPREPPPLHPVPPPATASSATGATTATTSSASPVPAPAPAGDPTEPVPVALSVIDDDIPAALAEARATGKLLFVEAWAAWCHTCISMKNYVLPDPSLVPLGAD